ncbi:MAG: hypothetical protein ABIH70_04045 [Chloroflexota bacterium]
MNAVKNRSTSTLNITSLNIYLLKGNDWAFWGAKRLIEVNGLSANLVENVGGYPTGTDILITPSLDKQTSPLLVDFVTGGGTLITGGGLTGTEFEKALDIVEQPSAMQGETIVLHHPAGDILLPALIDYVHKSNNIDGLEQYYEVDGNKYVFALERSLGKGRIILLSSLFSLVSKTYSWTSEKICNQDLLQQPYLDILSENFLEVIIKEANRRNKSLVRIGPFPDFKQEAAVLVTFDIDDKYSYDKTVKKSSDERARSWWFNLFSWPLGKMAGIVKEAAEQRLPTKAREVEGVSFLIRLWKGVNSLITPNFLELVEQTGNKAILFLRPATIQTQETQDKTSYELVHYEIGPEEVQRIAQTHEIGLHFGKSFISIGDVQAEEVKSFWTKQIAHQLNDLEENTGVKIYGSRGHFSLFYPETIEQVEAAGGLWDSTYYGQQRWVSSAGKLVEFGYNGFSPSWTASIVGTSLPFYPVIVRPGTPLRESSVLELPTTLYEPRDKKKAVFSSLLSVLKHHGIINIHYHPFDAVNYLVLKRILFFLRNTELWRPTGNELAQWWRQRQKTKVRNADIRLNGQELSIESNIETTLDTLSLIVNLPGAINISNVNKVTSSHLNIKEHEIEPSGTVISLSVQMKSEVVR